MAGRASRYLAGLCVGVIGLVAGGWLALTPYAFGYHGRERVTAVATGAGLVAVSILTLASWSALWRRRLRADGVLGPAVTRPGKRSLRRHARAERLVKATKRRELPVAPDPAQVLTDLRELLTPLLADQSLLTDRVVVHPYEAPPEPEPEPEPVVVNGADAAHLVQVPGQLRGSRSASFMVPPGPDRLKGAELLVVGSGEEESW